MAWAHVQTHPFNTATASNANAFSSVVVAGRLIVVGVFWNRGTANFSSIADTLGNTYIQIGSELDDTTNGVRGRLYYAKNILGGTCTITTTLTAAPTSFFYSFASEYSGLDTVAPFDTHVGSLDAASPYSLNLTAAGANELLWFAAVGAGSCATPSTFTQRNDFDSNEVADKNGVSGSNTVSGTFTGAWFIGFAAAFSETGVGGGPNDLSVGSIGEPVVGGSTF
jgi:hypothetical protein